MSAKLGQLTRRELQVAVLVAGGSSDREVAEKLTKNLDDETIYKIMRGNAIRMLSLDAD